MGASGDGWVHHNWTTQFCQTCYDVRAIDPVHPYAGLPDMAFATGRGCTQVGKLSELGRAPSTWTTPPRTSTSATFTGTNVVEATTPVEAATFATSVGGSVVRGIGFEKYAADCNAPSPAMVLDEAPNMTFQHDVFVGSASAG